MIAQDQLNSITLSFTVNSAAKFIDFLNKAFNAQEIVRYDSPEGEVKHAKIRIGKSAVAVGEANDRWRTKPTMIYMYVEDCDAAYEQALRAGAKSISAPADMSYGDRHGGVEDEWGNQWYVATPLL
ncbi:MAG: glyoxalase [Acidobacteria bacterium]|nr:MAG: glyoxalase [Acidobacteriota bacterium]